MTRSGQGLVYGVLAGLAIWVVIGVVVVAVIVS